MKHQIEESEFALRCACGDGSTFVLDQVDKGEELFIDYRISAFYAYQMSVWDKVKRSVSIIWTILMGKEYTLYEIVLDTKSKVEAFKRFVADIDTSKLIYE